MIFLFLSIDEMISIHENFTRITKLLVDTTGLLYYAWIIPYGIALIIFILTYSKFLLHLPKNIMLLFILSGSIFVLGAIGIEMFGGENVELMKGSNDSLHYAVLYTIEETLEMLGIALFIYTLLTYIKTVLHFPSIMITSAKEH
ncbi:MAG: hypothetical protein QM497_05785 [Sulfurimonas sp.]